MHTITALGYRPTALGYRPTALRYRPTALGYRPTRHCPTYSIWYASTMEEQITDYDVTDAGAQQVYDVTDTGTGV